MLTYDEFKESFCVKFPEVMGKKFTGYEIKCMPVKKRGKTLDGFTFCPKSEGDRVRAMPTYYFNDLYRSYCENGDVSLCAEEIARSMKCALRKGNTLTDSIDLKSIKRNVIAELVNPEVAESYIGNVPHRDFLNLSVIYRWVVSIDEEGVYSGIIDNELMGYVKLSEETLYKNAIKNTARILVPKLESFDSVVRRILVREGRNDDEIEGLLDGFDSDDRIWVITNDQNFRASTAMIYNEFLEDIAEEFDSDFYIVPTSVNESLVISANSCIPPENLLNMLHESNSVFLEDDDQVLSDTVYYFDRDSSELAVLEVGEVSV